MEAAESWDKYAAEFAAELTGGLREKFEVIAQAAWDYNWLPSMTADVILELPELADVAVAKL